MRLSAIALTAASCALAGCSLFTVSPVEPCDDDAGCPGGYRCEQGQCVAAAGPTTDAAAGDAPADAAGSDALGDGGASDRLDAALDSSSPPFDGAGHDVGAGDRPPTDAARADRAWCDAAACLASGNPCQSSVCVAGVCGRENAPEHQACPGGICLGGSCQPSCWINGNLVATGAREQGNPCRECQPASNPFQYVARTDGDSCDDGLWCTGTDRCLVGVCDHPYSGDGRCAGDGTHCSEALDSCVECLLPEHCADDGNPCTTADCSAVGQCGVVDNTAPCNDGLWCTGVDRCQSWSCTVHEFSGDERCPAHAPLCDEPNDRCVECIDNSSCRVPLPRCRTSTGTCVACLVGGDCIDDGNVCTTTACTSNVCQNNPNSANCDDGLWCNGTDTCDNTACLHQYSGHGRCSGVPNRPNCNENQNRCDCQAGSCPSGYACISTSGRCERSVEIPVTAVDDGYEDLYHDYQVLVAYNYMSLYSTSHVGGLRFQLNGVPPGANIVSASVRVYVVSGPEGDADVVFKIQDTVNAPAIQTTAYNISSRTFLSTTVTWNGTLAQGWNTSPSLKTLVQPIVNKTGWVAGNWILFQLVDSDGAFEFYQADIGYGATLVLTYELP